MKKSIAVLVAVLLVVGIAIGGTMAWLTDETDDIINTFTVGDIEIELDESDDLDLQMIPGWTITKDPVVTVAANSEPCWLFVKVEKSTNFNDFMNYTIATGWELVPGETDVYYREITEPKKVPAEGLPVLLDNKVNVNNTVTKDMMNGLTEMNYPTLTFTAYAIQLYQDNNVKFTVNEAWAKVPTTTL